MGYAFQYVSEVMYKECLWYQRYVNLRYKYICSAGAIFLIENMKGFQQKLGFPTSSATLSYQGSFEACCLPSRFQHSPGTANGQS